jgi:hypothetical protein
MKKQRLDHYSLSSAQVKHGEADAQAKRLKSTDIATILARHRQGDPQASKRLREAFEFLAWEARRNASPKHADSVLGQAIADIAVCVERLVRNDVPADGLQRYIAAEVAHSEAHYLLLDDDSIRPKGHASPLPPITRTRKHTRPKWEADEAKLINPLDDPKAAVAPSERGLPSRYDQRSPQDELIEAEDDLADTREREAHYQRLMPFAKNNIDRALLRARRDGKSTNEDDCKLLVCIARRILNRRFTQMESRAAEAGAI